MYKALKGCYWWLERTVISMLPPRRQQQLRDYALRTANRFFPGRIIVSNADELQALARGQLHEWSPPALPEWVLQEIKEISNEIDSTLHPEGRLVSSACFNAVPWTYSLPGDRYFAIRSILKGTWDVLIFVPWLKSGGADLGAIHFANVLAGHHFGQRVAVVATEDADSSWAVRLAPGVKFIAAGKLLKDLHEAHQLDILVRLTLQIAPKVVHVMNSRLAWEMIKRNGLAIRQQSKIFASLYCDDITLAGQPVGYARSYLVDCHQMLDGVISDNPITPDTWCNQIGVSRDMFSVVRFPAPEAPRRRIVSAEHITEIPHVLWAGRLDRQKRPDLLAAIAKSMPEVVFDLYGRAVMDDSCLPDFSGIPNVVIHGAYDRFMDLLADSPVAYLYTSQWDGLPNVLLEAASAGLPIVASHVGGVSDLLSDEQLVCPFDDVGGYVDRLRSLISRPALAADWKKRQFMRIEQAHTEQRFIASIVAIPGYAVPLDKHADEEAVDVYGDDLSGRAKIFVRKDGLPAGVDWEES